MSIDAMEVDPDSPNTITPPEPGFSAETPYKPSTLCSAYPQNGPVNMTARPATLTWTDQGQILCHGANQIVIAVSPFR